MASFIKRNGRWTARIRKTGYPETTQIFARKDSALNWSQKVENDPERYLNTYLTANSLETFEDLLRRCEIEVTPTKKSWKKKQYRVRSLQTLWPKRLKRPHSVLFFLPTLFGWSDFNLTPS